MPQLCSRHILQGKPSISVYIILLKFTNSYKMLFGLVIALESALCGVPGDCVVTRAIRGNEVEVKVTY